MRELDRKMDENHANAYIIKSFRLFRNTVVIRKSTHVFSINMKYYAIRVDIRLSLIGNFITAPITWAIIHLIYPVIQISLRKSFFLLSIS